MQTKPNYDIVAVTELLDYLEKSVENNIKLGNEVSAKTFLTWAEQVSLLKKILVDEMISEIEAEKAVLESKKTENIRAELGYNVESPFQKLPIPKKLTEF